MSSLYRYNYLNPEESGFRIINSNSIADEKIRLYMEELQEKQRTEDADLEQTDKHSDGFQSLEQVSEVIDTEELIQNAKEEAKQLITSAQNEAESIVAEASGKAEELCRQAQEKGRQAGYTEGIQQAEEEQRIWQQKLSAEREQLLEQIEQERTQMESELVDTILEVFESVFCIQFSDKKELLLHLIQNSVKGIGGAKQFQIKVPPERLREIEEQKELILENLGESVTVEIIADSNLHDNDCIIETENGIFECGPLIQLQNLIKDIRTLSYEGNTGK